MKTAFHLAILTALWKRPALSEIVLGHYCSMRDEILVAHNILLYVNVVVSPDDVIRYNSSIDYVKAPNHPLSNKFNSGLWAISRQLDYDAVMVVGSDDLVNARYIIGAVELIKAGADVVLPFGVHILDLPKREAIFIPRATPGVGRVYGRELLDKVGWNLWVPGRNRELDSSTFIVINPHDPRIETLSTFGERTIIALKGQENLWSAESLRQSAADFGGFIPERAERLLRQEFPGVAESLLNLYEHPHAEPDSAAEATAISA